MLNQQRTYVLSFMSLHELARDNAPTDLYRIVIDADKRLGNEHVRRYNGPLCSARAALIPENEDKRGHLSEETRQSNANGNAVFNKVSINHRSYNILSYVMLFPNGTDGWHPEFRFDAGEIQRKLTFSMLCSWRMSQRWVNSVRFFQAVGYSPTIW